MEIKMIYEIVYDAVERKAATTPPNDYIGNVEMAAGIGIVLAKIDKKLVLDGVQEPDIIREKFLEIVEETEEDSLDDKCKIIIEKVRKYQVKKMVNETMEDLIALVNQCHSVKQ
jgi:hypothetical protein